MANARSELNYGQGVAEILDPLDPLILRLKRTLGRPGFEAPTLPEAAMELLRLSHRPTTSIAEVVQVLERDPTLAAKLLQRARSPHYGTRPVQDLKQAAARLGINGMRDLVLQISMRMKVFKAPGFEPLVQEVMRYGQVRAALCPVIGRHARIRQPEAALCALMSDLGLVTALMVLAQPDPKRAPVPAELAWQAAEEVHTELGAKLARSWELPGELVSVIGHHHALTVSRVPNPLLATLLVSSAVAEHLDLGLHDPSGTQLRESKLQVNGARRLLGLNTDKMKRIVSQARALDLGSLS